MTNRKFIYIASPYSKGDIMDNVDIQIDTANMLLDAGHIPYTPLLNHFLARKVSRPNEFWIDTDLEVIRRCKFDGMLRLPGDSIGADKETAVAIALGVPVYHIRHSLKQTIEHFNKP